MQIRTMRDYRRAVTALQKLEPTKNDEESGQRYELLAAMHRFEQQHELPEYSPGKPAPHSVRAQTRPSSSSRKPAERSR
jgi:hypothetical protein